MKTRTSPKAAETWVPKTLDDFCGNHEIVEEFKARLELLEPEDESNVLLMGNPGTGKTGSLLCYSRLRLVDSKLGYGDLTGLFAIHAGKRYNFIRMDGGSRDEKHLHSQVQWACDPSQHTIVLLDEAGELFYQGFDEMIRPMLDNPSVTTYATAQNFHYKKRRGDTENEDQRRLEALLSRFKLRLYTEKPTEEEMIGFLKKRMVEFNMEWDKDSTIEELASKSDGVVRTAMGCLARCLSYADQKLTCDRVMRYNPDW